MFIIARCFISSFPTHSAASATFLPNRIKPYKINEQNKKTQSSSKLWSCGNCALMHTLTPSNELPFLTRSSFTTKFSMQRYLYVLLCVTSDYTEKVSIYQDYFLSKDGIKKNFINNINAEDKSRSLRTRLTILIIIDTVRIHQYFFSYFSKLPISRAVNQKSEQFFDSL